MKPLRKKGVLDNFGNLISTLGYLAILLAIIFLIIAQTKTTILDVQPCHNSSWSLNSTGALCCFPPGGNCVGYGRNLSLAYNQTGIVQAAMADVPPWLPIVVITVIGGILLTLVKFFKER